MLCLVPAIWQALVVTDFSGLNVGLQYFLLYFYISVSPDLAEQASESRSAAGSHFTTRLVKSRDWRGRIPSRPRGKYSSSIVLLFPNEINVSYLSCKHESTRSLPRDGWKSTMLNHPSFCSGSSSLRTSARLSGPPAIRPHSTASKSQSNISAWQGRLGA